MESTWAALGLPPEFTTVTKKERRVGLWDQQLLDRAVQLNGPCDVVLTFVDYTWPIVAGQVESSVSMLGAVAWAEFVVAPHALAGIGTGPCSVVWL
jgi:hypothetical protein